MDTINSISIDISVELGSTKVPVHQLLRMGRGAVIELDTMENDDLVLLANNTPIANGQVMLREDKILISITKLLPRPPEVRSTNVLHTFGGETAAEDDDKMVGDTDGFATEAVADDILAEFEAKNTSLPMPDFAETEPEPQI